MKKVLKVNYAIKITAVITIY